MQQACRAVDTNTISKLTMAEGCKRFIYHQRRQLSASHQLFFTIHQSCQIDIGNIYCCHDTLKVHFCMAWNSQEVVTDNEPQYSSKEFYNFAKQYSFKHQTSSPNLTVRQNEECKLQRGY